MKLADSGMTTRSHHVIFATGCGIFVVVTLLFLLQKTHTQLQDVQMRFIETQSRLKSLSSQFDSLFEYKERVEKALISLKNQRASLLEIDDTAKEDLSVVKINCDRQIKYLEEELRSCRDNDGGARILDMQVRQKLKAVEIADPVLAPLILLKPNVSGVPQSQLIGSMKSPGAHETRENGPVQSPIGHVPPHPGQPSGNPNEDTAGNVLI